MSIGGGHRPAPSVKRLIHSQRPCAAERCVVHRSSAWHGFWHGLLVMVAASITAPEEPAVTDSPLSRDELLARLAVIDAEGWDSPAGTDLLRYVRRTVVRTCVRLSGLRGREAVEAESTAWTAAWESLSSDYLRQTEAPMNVLWAVVRRAVATDLLAARWLTDDRECWRLSPQPQGRFHEAAPDHAEPPISLDRLVLGGLDRPVRPEEATPLLDRVVDLLVQAGWSRPAASLTVQAIAAHARTDGYRFGRTAGWRRLAPALDLPAWQVRRLTLLLVGAPGWPGVVERLAIVGDSALDEPEIREAARATLKSRRRMPARLGAWSETSDAALSDAS